MQILTNTDQPTTRAPPYWKYHYQNAMRPECAQGLATEFRLNSYSCKKREDILHGRLEIGNFSSILTKNVPLHIDKLTTLTLKIGFATF